MTTAIYTICRDCGDQTKTATGNKAVSVTGSCTKCGGGRMDFSMGSTAPKWWNEPLHDDPVEAATGKPFWKFWA